MGELSPSRDPLKGSQGRQNFGFIFGGFEEIGAVTHEWQQLHDFIEVHSRHKLVRLVDDQIAEAEWLEDDDEYDDEEDDEPPEGCVYSRLRLLCSSCGSETLTEHAAYCRPRPELVLSSDVVAHFVDQVWPTVEDNAYRCIPFDDTGASVVSFLRAHRSHRIATSLKATDA